MYRIVLNYENMRLTLPDPIRSVKFSITVTLNYSTYSYNEPTTQDTAETQDPERS